MFKHCLINLLTLKTQHIMMCSNINIQYAATYINFWNTTNMTHNATINSKMLTPGQMIPWMLTLVKSPFISNFGKH